MKQNLLLLSVLLLLISCGEDPSGSSDKVKKTTSYVGVEGDTVIIPYTLEAMSMHLTDLGSISYNMFKAINQHGISFREACQLITLYNRTFNSAHGMKGIGGCIPKTVIDVLPDNEDDKVSGIVYFLCYNKNREGAEDDEIYMAYRAVTDFDYSNDYYTHFTDEDFNLSSERVTRNFTPGGSPASVIDTPMICNYLEEAIAYVPSVPLTARFSDIEPLNREFKAAITGCKNPLNPDEDVVCTTMACGFFEKYALQRLISQTSTAGKDAEGVRFFLGYDPTLNENKIRIVIMGATGEGNLLYVTGGSGGPIYGNYIERSWP